jgi:hypothetical protein
MRTDLRHSIKLKNKKRRICRLPEFLHIRSKKADAQKKITKEDRFSNFFISIL